MATGLQTWSTAAASNNSADSNVNWAEGMAPSAVNNSARAEMASAAMWRDDNSGVLATTGTSSAFTVTSKQGSTAAVDGYTIAVKFHSNNSAAATLNVDSVGAKKMQLVAGTDCSSGDFVSGSIHRFRYDSGSTAWIAHGANLIGASAVSSDKIADGAVAYSKIQNVSAGTILGNGGSTAAPPAEMTIGKGLVATTGSITAPAFPPIAAFKSLSIKTATTTTVDCRADFVTLATSGSSTFITLPASGTINLGTNGSANTLDTGTLAASTFYAIWAIASTTSTHADFLASTSFTSPVMPSGYTIKARVGAQVTSTAGTPALHGVHQYGNKASYIFNLAGTSSVPAAASGTAGNVSTPTYVAVDVSPFVPTLVAHTIHLTAFHSGGTILVAPSTGYGQVFAAFGNRPPIVFSAANDHYSVPTQLTLETTNIYWASDTAGQAILINGWEDNI